MEDHQAVHQAVHQDIRATVAHQEEDHQAVRTDGAKDHQEDPLVHLDTTAPPRPPAEGPATSLQYELMPTPNCSIPRSRQTKTAATTALAVATLG